MKDIIFDLGNVLIGWDTNIVYKKHFNNNIEKVNAFYEETQIFDINSEMDAGNPFEYILPPVKLTA